MLSFVVLFQTNYLILRGKGVTTMNLIEQNQAIARLVAKCRADSDYKSSLINDTMTVLRESGVYLPEGLTIEFIPSGQEVPPSTSEVAYLSVDVLDKDPELLSEEALNQISAGASIFQEPRSVAGPVCTCVATRA